MADTLLTLVGKACGELGLVEPSAVTQPLDDIGAQMFRLANRVGEDLLRERDWSFLTVEGATFTLASGSGSYTLPADFDRLVSDTQWDRTNKWRTLGPDDPQTARWRREGVVQTQPRRALRQVGNAITVWPVPGTGDAGTVIAFDYVSLNWALSAAGAAQAAFLADTDAALFPSHLVVLGLKWRWMAAKGMDATFPKTEYDMAVKRAFARDQGGARTLSMAPPWKLAEEANADGVVAGAPTVVLGTSNGAGIGVD